MKKLAALLLSLLMILSFSACAKTDQADKEGQGEKTLVVSTWGLGEEHLMEDVFKPFEEKFNVKVVLEMATTAERLNKLKENPNSEVDVIELSQAAAADAQDLGLVDKVDPAKVENIDKLIAPAKEVADKGYGAPFVVNSIGIIYNPNTIKKEIKEWADLWDEDLKGKVAIPDITTTFGPAMVALAGELANTPIDKDNGAQAFKKLEELKPNIVKAYAKSSDLAAMFANGEVDAAVIGDFGVDMIKKANENAVYVVPQSGTYVNFNTVEINKNSKNKDLALEYLNFRLSQEVQERTAKSLNEGPTNADVKLDEETALNKTYGDVINRTKVLDHNMINKNLSDWVEKFNAIMNK
ncbi:MAG: ABC transporter substrate-binding protein [Tissierellia bacterium]|nr:ABC transporter substrate-binding protein [Tissierellia bacterium]